MSIGRSQRALRLFAVLAIPFALWQTLDWSPRPVFLVADATDGVAHLHKEVHLVPGLRILSRATIQTQSLPALLTFEGTSLTLDSRSQVKIKEIATDHLSFFSTRGHVWMTPDRQFTFCTRATCTTSNEPIELFYYTPGEVVEIRAAGEATVTFLDTDYFLHAGDKLTIDELTHDVQTFTP
ncbi:hypothetical protein COV06_01055 [Candidatus Uhrbacteria bacterium CG10_big_fil_rev_8_21_14_0_10_50_16]|uniref:FecR protein domain-containing protein n=1 Tax=Candidatus Uhrbacteria bacterium CG10_big_fil_rev_8_21_14_0_10_50_16 TaxID=1975039 RepID=A0A2H0RN52_9BACT|nr:MAG: hypothetical protein COV06_01055 [Candidatus Uhrbacteria bacterium CG10_big_fil_rev_8_21_14_0_10_50_16]